MNDRSIASVEQDLIRKIHGKKMEIPRVSTSPDDSNG